MAPNARVCAAAMAHPLCRAHRLRPGSPPRYCAAHLRAADGGPVPAAGCNCAVCRRSITLESAPVVSTAHAAKPMLPYASACACCANSHMLVRLIMVRGTDGPVFCRDLQHDATRCNPMQHVVTRCNALQHIATKRNTIQTVGTHYNMVQPIAWRRGSAALAAAR